MEKFYAHIRKDQDGTEKYQTVQEHCEAVAKYAGACLADAGLEQVAYLAGLLHDGGKLTQKFQAYLAGQGKRGSVIHSFTGVRLLLERFHGPTFSEFQNLTSELLAYAVGAHHGQFDCIDEKRRSGFRHRLEKPDIGYEESVENLFRQGMAPEELDALFTQAHGALQPVYMRLMDLTDQGRCGSESAFYLGLLCRLLLSAVIEGDRRDTAEFMTDAVFPEQPEDRRDLWTGRLSFLEAKLACFSADTPIDRARRDISNQCRTCAEQSGGVFRLNVPTGAGKTLSALRFALAHSARWNKARIIFTSPLLSILEQNAQVLRDYIGDDSLILEHHSNVVRTSGETDSLDPYELLEENWRSPVVITTLVQLLNTLFDGRTSSVRRFQSLVNSVIVIDEVQTVPNHMLSMFNLAVSFLVEVCGATVVLCSATQPCLEQAARPLAVTPVDMVPNEPALWAAFRRTEIRDAGSLPLEEIPGFVWDVLDQADSLLLICNKKDQAADLYRKLEGQGVTCFHLSAAMCMAHRRQVLAELGQALEQSRHTGEKVLCVATQVMEAAWTSPLPGQSGCLPGWTVWSSRRAAATGTERTRIPRQCMWSGVRMKT